MRVGAPVIGLNKIDNYNKDKDDGSEIGRIIDFKKAEKSKTY